MINLWLGFALLSVLAILFLVLPRFINIRGGDVERQQSNIDIYKSQLNEVAAEHAAGNMSDESFAEISMEIKRNLLIDTEQGDLQENNTSARPSTLLIAVCSVLIVVGSGLLYNQLGASNDLAITELLRVSTTSEYKRENAVELVERLNVQVIKTPEDVEAWYLIGRINFELGQYDEAVLGFSSVLQHLPEEAKEDQAAAMAQLAQAQFFANDRKLDKATESLLLATLELNPDESTALGLLGVSAYDKRDYPLAVKYWQKLLSFMAPNNPNAMAITGGIDKAISQMDAQQKQQYEQDLLTATQAGASIVVTVDVSEDMRKQLPKNADLFVLAKAKSGPPMPLAVKRLNTSSWPITVTLDDSLAMMPSLKLSNFNEIIITARISKSGVGNAKAGDLQGDTGAMAVSATSAKVIINTVVQ